MFHKEPKLYTEKCREHLPDYLHQLSFNRNNTNLQNLFLKYVCGYRGCDSEKLEQNFYYHDFCVIQIRMRKHSWILAWARHSPSSLQTSILHWSSYFGSPFIKSTYKYTFTYLGVFACLSDLCVVSHSASVMKPWLVTITCAPCEFPHSEMGRNAGSMWKAYTQELRKLTVGNCWLLP